jgi:predicted RNA-binding Zn-ribbon protein involved in translation (DUF1610 family)
MENRIPGPEGGAAAGGTAMQENNDQSRGADKSRAAVCGLYCEACSIYIATTEEPERLKKHAAAFGITEEACRCYGCGSQKRLPYCDQCRMYDCAAERGIDFCSQCETYPCNDLKRFQAERPHRIELWKNLERIRSVGYEQWMKEIREHYTCPTCGTLNSTYDLKCRKCGEEPSCGYVAEHGEVILQYLKNR